MQVTIEQPAEGTAVATCVLEGKPREVLGARLLIQGRELHPGPAGAAQGRAGTAGGQGGGGAGGAAAASLELYLPTRVLGHVIGKGGKCINAARQATGCDLKVIIILGEITKGRII